ncbi:hypothetical protein ACWEV3_17935 [Saccharopolyspora sp. NPDC003752]
MPELAWLPFATNPPREQLALATTAVGTWPALLEAAAELASRPLAA